MSKKSERPFKILPIDALKRDEALDLDRAAHQIGTMPENARKQTHTYKGNAPVRLNKWMAELGLCSRREAEALISGGGVFVEGERVEEPGHKIGPGQTLSLSPDASRSIESKFTAILNKPVGYVSAQPEEDQVPAARLLTAANATSGGHAPARNAPLAPLGRLDQDSRGLLLLSQDGVLAKAIIGPHHGLEKEYLVTVDGQITEGKLTLLRNGLSLDERRLKPAKVSREEDKVLRFVLREGRKRQLRRMCDLVGLKVTDLVRVRIGPLSLGDLPEGKWREITAKEREALIKTSLPERPKRVRDEKGKPVRKGRNVFADHPSKKRAVRPSKPTEGETGLPKKT